MKRTFPGEFLEALACNFSKRVPIPRETLMEVAVEGWLQAWTSFNPDLGVVWTTHLYNQVMYQFRGLVKQQILEQRYRTEIPNAPGLVEMMVSHVPAPDEALLFQDMFDNLSALGKDVVRMVLEEDWSEDLSPAKIRSLLRQELQSYGWSRKMIRETFQELQEAFCA